MVESDEQFARQYVALQELWVKWRRLVVHTGVGNKEQAELAVTQLYDILGYPTPRITWIAPSKDGKIVAPELGLPWCHLRTMLLAPWGELSYPERLTQIVGYHNGEFRLPGNKALILHHMTLPLRSRRPLWLRTGANLICRFDADVLALLELAQSEDLAISQKIWQIAEAITTMLRHCFGGFFFRHGCWLIEPPYRIELDEVHWIMAQYPRPAFKYRSTSTRSSIWSRRGIILPEPRTRYASATRSVDTTSMRFLEEMLGDVERCPPDRRPAMIDYYGWNEVLDACKRQRHYRYLASDEYGLLCEMAFTDQTFTLVQVKNATPEPDGSYRYYAIPVDPRLRPLPNPNDPSARFGAPQQRSALNAVASTFGMTGAKYVELLGRQS